jgi:CRISPR-associated protein (TIGR02584 family)
MKTRQRIAKPPLALESDEPGKAGDVATETVFLAVTGMSSAILTETVWALAHPPNAGSPVVPDRIVAITTLPGKGRIEDELFKACPHYAGQSVWQALRQEILGPGFERDPRLNLDTVQVISQRDPTLGRSFPLEDIRTPADNDVAADFILEEVRKLTENADIRVVASLAGGRKTMGALLYAALSLLGRPQDRLTHVLVSEPFEDPGLEPRFYFPANPETLHEHPRTGGVHSGHTARLWLADVPFVRLRELFPQQLGHYPGSFGALVKTCSEQIEEISGPPAVVIEPDTWTITVNGVRLVLAPREFALFSFLAERCMTGKPAYRQQKLAVDDFAEWLEVWGRRFAAFTRQRELMVTWKHPSEEDFRKQISAARKRIRAAGLGRFEPFLLPQRGAFGLRIRQTAD